MVTGIQLIGALFSLVLTYFTFLHYKRQEFTFREFLGWEALWICFAAITLFPNSFNVFAGNLGAWRPFDLYSVLGFIVLLGISFYTYVNVDRLRKNLEKAIRDLALSELDKDKK